MEKNYLSSRCFEANYKYIILLIILFYCLAIITIPFLHQHNFKNLKFDNFNFFNQNKIIFLPAESHSISYISGHERLSQHVDNKPATHIYLTNHHKTALKLTNHENNMQGIEQKYTAYGDLIKKNDLAKVTHIPNPFAFNGERFNLHTKLQYLKARFYYPHLTRFTSQDSIHILNKFNYADNNPISKYDPSGHFATDFFKFALNILPTLTIPELLPAVFSEVITGFIAGYIIPQIATKIPVIRKLYFATKLKFPSLYNKFQYFCIGGLSGSLIGMIAATTTTSIVALITNKMPSNETWLKSLMLGAITGFIFGSLGKITNYKRTLNKLRLTNTEISIPEESIDSKKNSFNEGWLCDLVKSPKENELLDECVHDYNLRQSLTNSTQGLSSTESMPT